MKYKWTYGVFPIKAEIAANELNKLKEITPENVVSLATSKKNPLHKCFEWNNKIAADKYRVIQAEKIIRSVVIVSDTPEQEAVRAFVSVETNRQYKDVTNLNKNDINFVVQSAYVELQQFVNKYSVFEKLESIIEVIKKNIPNE